MSPKLVQGQEAPPVPSTSSSYERILRVAKTLFAVKGYEHSSTSAIARMANTSESQLMKHFGSKQGLLEAIFIVGWDEITVATANALENITSPREKLTIILQTVVRAFERDPELKTLILLEGRRVRKEGHAVAITESFLRFVELMDGVLVEMQASKLLRANLNPHAMRSALMGMVEGLLRDRFLAERLGYPADFNLVDIGQMVMLVTDAFMVPA